VESTPKCNIYISSLSLNDVTAVNMFKLSLKRHISYEWDWWPQRPLNPNVSPDMFRFQWMICLATRSNARSVYDLNEYMSVVIVIRFSLRKCRPLPCSLPQVEVYSEKEKTV
jgi:hypothetical protein